MVKASSCSSPIPGGRWGAEMTNLLLVLPLMVELLLRRCGGGCSCGHLLMVLLQRGHGHERYEGLCPVARPAGATPGPAEKVMGDGPAGEKLVRGRVGSRHGPGRAPAGD